MSLIIHPIYEFVGNYGVAVILFTLIVKIILFPLGIKQQKTAVKTKQVKPELDKIQAKYKNDKQKLNEETMKLYQKYDINPMGGCLPLLVQLPILIGLYRVIQFPIRWVLRNPSFYDAFYNLEMSLDKFKEVIKGIYTSVGQEAISLEGFTGIEEIINKVLEKGSKITEIHLASGFDLINFDFLGMDLSQTPSISQISPLWIIPILATGSAFFSNWVTSKINPVSAEQAQQMKTMNMMMPLMTAFFTFTLPAGIGLYWFISTIFSVGQTVLLTKYFEKRYSGSVIDVKAKKVKGNNK